MVNRKITLTETELNALISESVKRVLMQEGWIGDTYDVVKNKVKDTARNVGNAIDDFHTGRKVKEGKPSNIKDVFESNGWVIAGSKTDANGDILIKVFKNSTYNPITIEALVDDLNIYLSEKNKGTASYDGQYIRIAR